MTRTLALALRFGHREWRAGALGLLAASLVVAVGAITAVGFFTDRVESALSRQAGEALGADLVVTADAPHDAAVLDEVRAHGFEAVRTLLFPTVLRRGEASTLATIKAVEDGYPPRGAVGVTDTPYGETEPLRRGPEPGNVWLEARLLSLLDLSVGETVDVGAAELRITRVLVVEPDRSDELFAVAPHALMHRADVAATGLVRPASRVRYRLLLAGEPERVAELESALEPLLGERARVQQPGEARPRLATALERGRRFLALAALVSVILAGVAVAAAARQHARSHLDGAAVMRTLGASGRRVLAIHGVALIVTGLAASLAGCTLGYAAQFGLTALLGGLIDGALPPAGPMPIIVGVATGMVLLLGFAVPPLLQVGRVPPGRVLRRELGAPPTSALVLYGTAPAAVIALLWWHTGDGALTLRVAAGGLGAVAVLAAVGYALVRALGGLRGRVGISWRYGIANIARRRTESVAQIVGLGVGITALLLLGLVRADLLDGWRASLPPDAPNHFLINIQGDQRTPLRAFFEEHGRQPPRLYPMVRARLTAIDGQEVDPEAFDDPQARRFATREFNLSWADELRPGNEVVAGQWWDGGDRGARLLSVEEDFAETLGLAIGDRLRFAIGGERVELRVDNLRGVRWDSFRVNFFTIAPPGVLDDYPATYVTSFHLPPARRDMLGELMERFPSVSVIDVEAILGQVRRVIDRVSLAVQYVFGFTLAAGLMVLLTAVQASRAERRYEAAVLRALGAPRRMVLRALAAEFAALGLLAGLVGALAASATGYLLATQLFGFAYHPDPAVLLVGGLGGLAGVAAAGLAATRGVLDQPPLTVISEC